MSNPIPSEELRLLDQLQTAIDTLLDDVAEVERLRADVRVFEVTMDPPAPKPRPELRLVRGES